MKVFAWDWRYWRYKSIWDNIFRFSNIESQLPPPMKAFLSNYNFEGKIIIPFNTNGGYGIGNSFKTINKLATNSKISWRFSIKVEVREIISIL